ncbi:MAG: retroviral-like aspartic protease family protein [Akkermansiaceae bacterium]|nr:retroviral-like aspartic protease family protein [Armatimonadota bacterium]
MKLLRLKMKTINIIFLSVVVIYCSWLASMASRDYNVDKGSNNQIKMPLTRLRESSGLVPIKTTEVDKRPLITVSINRISNVMLIDTGAANTSILPESASRSFLKKDVIQEDEMEKSEYKDLAGREAVNIGDEEYIADSLEIGQLIINTTPLIKQKNTNKKQLILNMGVDGIIGLNTIEECGLMVDIKNKKMVLTWNGNLNKAEREALGFSPQSSYSPLKMKAKTTSKFTIPVLLKGTIELPMIVDTGATRTYITESWYKKYFGKLPRLTTRTARSAWGKSQLRTFKTDLKIENMVFPNVEVGVIADAILPYDGVVGMDVLSQKRFLIDYPARKMYFSGLSETSLSSIDRRLESIVNASSR